MTGGINESIVRQCQFLSPQRAQAKIKIDTFISINDPERNLNDDNGKVGRV